MPEDKRYSQTTNENLMKELDRLRDELQDLEQERQYLLRLAGVHVSGSSVKSLEAAIESIQEALREIGGILQERGFGTRLLAPEIKKP
ncbi:MAG: hypothetical protein ABSA82_02020 [Thermacetogeniaceae bacterium]|jgi:hypothetical protein